MSPEPALRTVGLARRFGPRWALRGVDLEVGWGSAVALVGPNGSGKSTLLRILAGALSPTRGGAWVAGRPLPEDGDAVRAVVGLLAGDAFLYEDLTAAENLAFALRMWGRRAPDGRIGRELARVGLNRVDGVRVRSFSSGMRKRLALARALAAEPRVLLLDEPYANLDEDGSGLVDRIVRRRAGEGRAVLVATHRRDRAAAVCHRTIRLGGGRRVDVPSAPARGHEPGQDRGPGAGPDPMEPDVLAGAAG